MSLMPAMKEFRKMNPPFFDSLGDPVVAGHWLSQVHKIFDTVRIIEDDVKVSFASYQLAGKVNEWWESIKEAKRVDRGMTWADFESTFEDQYFLEIYLDELRDQFEKLVQCDMIVSEHAIKFQSLFRFAPDLLAAIVVVEIWASNQQSILLGFLGTRPRKIKGRPAQTNRNKGPGRGRSKPLRRGDQTKAMTEDGVMGRVRGSRRDPRKDEYGKISRRYRRHNWKGFWWGWRAWRWSLEMEILSTLPRPRARRRQYFNSDQLMSILMVALASSVETAWRGSVDSFYLGQEGSEIKFGVLNAEMGLRRMDVWRCSVSLRARLKLSDLAKVVAQKAATSASKGVVISEGSETTSGKRALDDGSKGKQVAQSPEPKKARIDTRAPRAPAKPPVASGAGSSAQRTLGEALGPQASVMASAATAEKILAGVILPADKEKVDKLTFDQVVTKFIHALGQGVILGSSLAVRSRDFAESALNQKAVAESAEMEMVRAQNRTIELEGALAKEKAKGKKLAEDADARSKVIAKLEARISELEKSQSLTQGRIIAAFKESDDFLEAVRGSASSYFGDGFDFCKRQLAHQYPDLGVDLEDVEMDHEFLAKEEAETEQRAAEEGAAGAEGVGEAV
ncbi:hypothetical protein Acr_00g0080240 [Actinidia rufa]|uniref:Retrotransposon gag domain-containing protein n=1 Tax=Actinidia rufa TaxID=165716 RepID=A0A7J0DUC0_9ERIC|nr:hypothetical protein Acr_00g0080240 [Actinidia rufa]